MSKKISSLEKTKNPQALKLGGYFFTKELYLI